MCVLQSFQHRRYLCRVPARRRDVSKGCFKRMRALTPRDTVQTSLTLQNHSPFSYSVPFQVSTCATSKYYYEYVTLHKGNNLKRKFQSLERRSLNIRRRYQHNLFNNDEKWGRQNKGAFSPTLPVRWRQFTWKGFYMDAKHSRGQSGGNKPCFNGTKI